jgi:hypothetical protein
MRQSGVWRRNNTLLEETFFRDKLKELWSRWRRTKRFYPNRLEWWDRYPKLMIRRHSNVREQKGIKQERIGELLL